MKKTPVNIQPEAFPAAFHSLLAGCQVFDSSCSREARVWYVAAYEVYG